MQRRLKGAVEERLQLLHCPKIFSLHPAAAPKTFLCLLNFRMHQKLIPHPVNRFNLQRRSTGKLFAQSGNKNV